MINGDYMWNGATCNNCNGKRCTVCTFKTKYVIKDHFGRTDFGKMQLYKITIEKANK